MTPLFESTHCTVEFHRRRHLQHYGHGSRNGRGRGLCSIKGVTGNGRADFVDVYFAALAKGTDTGGLGRDILNATGALTI